MRRRIQQRYIAILLIPFVLVISLAGWLTYYAYHRGVQVMRQDVEKSSLRMAESMSSNVDTLIGQIQLSATNLAIQIAKVNNKPNQLAMYRSTIDQLTHLQLNAESILNPLAKYGYVFLFEENRAISQSSTVHMASELFEKYVRVNESTYEDFKAHFTANHYAGRLLPNTAVGFLDETYNTWIIAQTIPADPFISPIGVILFTLNLSALRQRVGDVLADEDSLCMVMDESGAYVMAQGRQERWDDAQVAALLAKAAGLPQGVHYITTADGVEQLICIVDGAEMRAMTAQPVANALQGVQAYNTLMIVLAIGMMLLAMVIAVAFTRRNFTSVQDVLDAIAPQNQSGNAKDVFEYIQNAMLSMQQRNAQLSTHADTQRALLRSIFLRRFLRGEFLLESDLLREQHVALLPIDAPYYMVLLIRTKKTEAQPEAYQAVRAAVLSEFGDSALVVDMGIDDTACLLLSEDAELRESVEAIADGLSGALTVRIYASSTVTDAMDIPRAYREVRTMADIAQEESVPLLWYDDMFQDDVLYNYEYNLYTEKKLRNTIATGDTEETENTLAALYENSVKGSNRSPRVLRFFAYDLYRLINHIDPMGDEDGDRAFSLRRIQEMLDGVIENSNGFDQYFAEIQAFCLRVCQQNKAGRRSNNNTLRQQILGYIHEHYQDPELNVSSIARAFSISDKYLSQFFKEQTNERISGYIESMRIAHACRLMDTTALTINEVALQSGYAHTHTFRAAFKKVQGITPTQYRANTKEGKEPGD